ncbi:MAG: hypothetical protein ACKV2T_16405 [Kofleriaceae bacterium]
MTWDRRSFVTGLGVAVLASACKRATPTSHTDELTPPNPGDPIDPGFHSVGRSPLVADGEGWIELGDGVVIRRDAKLAETGRIAIEGGRSVAVLADRSLIVCATSAGSRIANHVAGNAIASSHASTADWVLPTESADAYWAVGSRWIDRVAIGGTATRQYPLPENSYPFSAAVTSDHRVVIANLYGILRTDPELATFAWENPPSHLGAGPDASLVWASLNPWKNGPAHVALVKLDGAAASAIAKHALPAGEAIVHFSGNGAVAVATTARSLAPSRAAFSLVAYDSKGERWRVALGEDSQGYYTAMSATRVVVLAKPSNALRSWDLATGKETS